MAYTFYDAAISISSSPKDEIIELNNNVVLEDLEVANTFTVIKEQTMVGGASYSDINCRLMSLIDPKTGKNFGDEYRKIVYDNYNHKKWLGRMYEFDNYTWLATNTSTTINASAHSVLRRCNNYLKWIDNNGVLRVWPCVFERSIGSENPKDNSSGVSQIWGVIAILVQRNEYTNTIKFNDRFLFDGIAFQVQEINNHISDTFLELNMMLTQIQNDDDIVNNIANGKTIAPISATEIKILPDISNIVLNNKQVFTVYKYVNGVQNSDAFTVTVNGATLVNYELINISGNSFSIENLIATNSLITIHAVDNNDDDFVDKTVALSGKW